MDLNICIHVHQVMDFFIQLAYKDSILSTNLYVSGEVIIWLILNLSEPNFLVPCLRPE